MNKIPEPDLDNCAQTLTPAEMNRIHFGGNHTPLSPEQIKEMANSGSVDIKKNTEKQS